MKRIERNELKSGEIYLFDNNFLNLVDFSKDHYITNWININIKVYRNQRVTNPTKDIIEATPEQKHWLRECIKADKFIPFEKALETFNPLPDNWYLEVNTIEEDKVLTDWVNITFNRNVLPICFNRKILYDNNGRFALKKYEKEFIEGKTKITFEDFKKYVLKTLEIELNNTLVKLQDVIDVIKSNYDKNDAEDIIKLIKTIKNEKIQT